MTPQEIDSVADQAATAFREIRKLTRVAETILEVEGEKPAQESVRADAEIEQLLGKIAIQRKICDQCMHQLRPFIIERAARIAGVAKESEFPFIAFSHVAEKISTATFGKNRSDSANVANFEKWLSVVLSRKHIDWQKQNNRMARAKRLAREKIQADRIIRGVIVDDRVEAAARPSRIPPACRSVPQSFSPAEEELLNAVLSSRQRHLLLYSSGLWSYLSTERKIAWNEWPIPTAWECSELSALQRANNFAIACAEVELAEIARFANAGEKPFDSESEFQSLRAKHNQWVAQNVKRHYWQLLRCDTAWQHVLQYVEPAKADVLDMAQQSLSPEMILVWLHFDLWLAIDHPARWFSWFEDLDITNTTDRNFVRAFEWLPVLNHAKSHVPGLGSLNEMKLSYAARCAGISQPSPELSETLLAEATEAERTIAMRLISERVHVDLPIPFRELTKHTTETEK